MPTSKHFEIVGLPLSTYSMAVILHSSHVTYLYINTKFFIISFAVKAKTTEEIMNNRPPPGVLDPSLAIEYKVMYYILTLGVPIILLLMVFGNRTV